MWYLSKSTLLLTVTLLSSTFAATSDPVCIGACSDYSVVLGHCRSLYGDLAYMQNMTFANEFVDCVCTGQEEDAVLGNDALFTSVGICQACTTTPGKIKKDLSMLMDLCVIQQANGTASEAIHYMPVGYTTSEAAAGRPAGVMSAEGRSGSGGIRTASLGSAAFVGLVGLIVISVSMLR